ncbi:hypothetical protein DV515_00002853 [Chloebia gouldiae]|uniref:Uncharacterized protein n=1 Tax=Chloebia gouldiae TaxID=44316 RepID=A0A3L8SUI1_CHLGU|nr:hypothetical protein DV515_00002853 [Chloebia gouldiae]
MAFDWLSPDGIMLRFFLNRLSQSAAYKNCQKGGPSGSSRTCPARAVLSPCLPHSLAGALGAVGSCPSRGWAPPARAAAQARAPSSASTQEQPGEAGQRAQHHSYTDITDALPVLLRP